MALGMAAGMGRTLQVRGRRAGEVGDVFGGRSDALLMAGAATSLLD